MKAIEAKPLELLLGALLLIIIIAIGLSIIYSTKESANPLIETLKSLIGGSK